MTATSARTAQASPGWMLVPTGLKTSVVTGTSLVGTR